MQSATCPPVSRKASGRQCRSVRAWIPAYARTSLRRAPTARAADGLGLLPPLPPEAQRCALTAELSIRTWAGGPPALASVSNSPTQTPLAAQRTKRL